MTSPALTSRCGFAELPVDVHLAALARLLRLRARLEEARDVEPDVEADGFSQGKTCHGIEN